MLDMESHLQQYTRLSDRKVLRSLLVPRGGQFCATGTWSPPGWKEGKLPLIHRRVLPIVLRLATIRGAKCVSVVDVGVVPLVVR